MLKFESLFKKAQVSDTSIVSLGKGKIIAASTINDPAFAQEMMGQTVAYELSERIVVAPANGILEVMFPTGHAFAIRMKDGTGLLVHIGIDTVELNGNGFKVLAKQGSYVKAGQPIVEVNWDHIKNKGFETSTMMIITETDKRWKLLEPGAIKNIQEVAWPESAI